MIVDSSAVVAPRVREPRSAPRLLNELLAADESRLLRPRG